MKTIDNIPITKISRASKLVSTGAKVGVNYLKYYGDKIEDDSWLVFPWEKNNSKPIQDYLDN